jgi:hypothetical protein
MPSDVSVGDQELNNVVVCKSVQVDILTDVRRLYLETYPHSLHGRMILKYLKAKGVSLHATEALGG